jgi:hypothetical protein
LASGHEEAQVRQQRFWQRQDPYIALQKRVVIARPTLCARGIAESCSEIVDPAAEAAIIEIDGVGLSVEEQDVVHLRIGVDQAVDIAIGPQGRHSLPNLIGCLPKEPALSAWRQRHTSSLLRW